MKPKISIIIPIYNMQKYMKQCIESILNQTYKNFEVILVNDGSTDSSGRICDDFGAMDKRVVVCHQNNVGVGEARNKGIKMASGEFIVFADPDDYLETNYLESVVDEAEQYDLLITNAYYTYSTHEERGRYFGPESGCEFQQKDINELRKFSLRRVLINGELFIPFFGVPWMKIYKKHILEANQIKFVSNVHPMEDTIFNLDYIAVCNRVKYINKPFYHYRIHNLSSTSGVRKNRYENFENGFTYLKQHYLEDSLIRDEIYDWAVGMIWFSLSRQSFNHKCFERYRDRKEDFLKHTEDSYIMDVLQNCNYKLIPLEKKVMLYFYKNKNALMLEIICQLFRALKRK